MGRLDTCAGRLPDQSIFLAGEGVAWKGAGSFAERQVREEPLPVDLLSPLGRGCGRGIREISHGDGGGDRAVSQQPRACFRCWWRWRCSTGTRASGSREKLGGAPIFSSDKLDMYEMVSILRQCDRMLSSRFHAIVTSMPAGVPSAGVTMDERIRNLMRDRGHEHLLMRVDEQDLGDKIVVALRALDVERGRNSRLDGADRRAQLAADGAHGRLFRGAGGAAVSGISGAHGRAGMGRVSCRRSARACSNCSSGIATRSKRRSDRWRRLDVSRDNFRAARRGGEHAGARRSARRADRLRLPAANCSR